MGQGSRRSARRLRDAHRLRERFDARLSPEAQRASFRRPPAHRAEARRDGPPAVHDRRPPRGEIRRPHAQGQVLQALRHHRPRPRGGGQLRNAREAARVSRGEGHRAFARRPRRARHARAREVVSARFRALKRIHIRFIFLSAEYDMMTP